MSQSFQLMNNNNEILLLQRAVQVNEEIRLQNLIN